MPTGVGSAQQRDLSNAPELQVHRGGRIALKADTGHIGSDGPQLAGYRLSGALNDDPDSRPLRRQPKEHFRQAQREWGSTRRISVSGAVPGVGPHRDDRAKRQQRGHSHVMTDDAEVAGHSDDPPLKDAPSRGAYGYADALLGQVEKHPGEPSCLGSLLAQPTLPHPGAGGLRSMAFGRPAGQIGEERFDIAGAPRTGRAHACRP